MRCAPIRVAEGKSDPKRSGTSLRGRVGRPNLEFNRLSPICHCCRLITVDRKAAQRLWARLTRKRPPIVFFESKLVCALYRSPIDK